MTFSKFIAMFRRPAGEKPFSKVALTEKIAVNPLMLRGLNIS
jgi:hypothetical protein